MNYDKYQDISISTDAHEFKFTSIGIKGNLEKLVQLKKMGTSGEIYNVALGTIISKDEVDFSTVSKNGDRNKILATIADCAFVFSKTYPERQLFLTGDIPSKTRLYQMAINEANYELSKTFIIKGLLYNKVKKKFIPYDFKKGTNYDAFLFIRNADVVDSKS